MKNDDAYHKLFGAVKHIDTGKEANSETDALKKNVKRNNLIEFFLKGNEIDNYLAAHYYGKGEKFKNINDETIGE